MRRVEISKESLPRKLNKKNTEIDALIKKKSQVLTCRQRLILPPNVLVTDYPQRG